MKTFLVIPGNPPRLSDACVVTGDSIEHVAALHYGHAFIVEGTQFGSRMPPEPDDGLERELEPLAPPDATDREHNARLDLQDRIATHDDELRRANAENDK